MQLSKISRKTGEQERPNSTDCRQVAALCLKLLERFADSADFGKRFRQQASACASIVSDTVPFGSTPTSPEM